MPGPKPKPTHLKVLQGNPGKRKLNKREPQGAPLSATPPTWLLPGAKREWKRLLKAMPTGMVQTLDRAEFARFCQTYARWEHAERSAGVDNQVTVTKSGYEQTSGSLLTALKLGDHLDKLADRLGLNPPARSKLEIPKSEDGENPWSKLKR